MTTMLYSKPLCGLCEASALGWVWPRVAEVVGALVKKSVVAFIWVFMTQMNAGRAATVGRVIGGTREVRPAGVTLVLEHSVGTGTFVANDALRNTTDYVLQTWDIRPYFNWEVGGHLLELQGRFSLGYEFTDPSGNAAARRFQLQDVLFTLQDATLYVEPHTATTLSILAQITAPLSYASRGSYGRYFAAGLTLGLSRNAGPVALVYRLGVTRYFNKEGVQRRTQDVWRGGEAMGFPLGGRGPDWVAAGVGNTELRVFNTFALSGHLTANLTIAYVLVIINELRTAVTDDVDALTQVGADAGRGRADYLWPTLQLTYGLTNALQRVADLPITLALGVGVTSFHPAQSSDNKHINWPFFVSSMGYDRAANNSGSFYVDVMGTY